MSEIPENNTDHNPRLTALYRAAAADQPPAALDDAVLAAAHRAVAARPQPAGWAPRWRLPLATAALIVLSASLVITIYQEAPPEMAPPVASRQDNPTMPPATSKESDADRVAAWPRLSEEGRREVPADADSVASNAAVAKAVTPSPFPAAPAEAPAATGTANNAPALDARTATAARAAQEAGTAAGVMAPPPAAAATGSGPSALSDHLSTERRAKAESALSQKLTADAAPAAELAPEPWLAQILALRRQGEIESAKARFAEFRKRYPDYPLPPALKDWAPPPNRP